MSGFGVNRSAAYAVVPSRAYARTYGGPVVPPDPVFKVIYVVEGTSKKIYKLNSTATQILASRNPINPNTPFAGSTMGDIDGDENGAVYMERRATFNPVQFQMLHMLDVDLNAIGSFIIKQNGSTFDDVHLNYAGGTPQRPILTLNNTIYVLDWATFIAGATQTAISGGQGYPGFTRLVFPGPIGSAPGIIHTLNLGSIINSLGGKNSIVTATVGSPLAIEIWNAATGTRILDGHDPAIYLNPETANIGTTALGGTGQAIISSGYTGANAFEIRDSQLRITTTITLAQAQALFGVSTVRINGLGGG